MIPTPPAPMSKHHVPHSPLSPEYTESCQPAYGGNVFSQDVEDTGGEEIFQVGEGGDEGEEGDMGKA